MDVMARLSRLATLSTSGMILSYGILFGPMIPSEPRTWLLYP